MTKLAIAPCPIGDHVVQACRQQDVVIVPAGDRTHVPKLVLVQVLRHLLGASSGEVVTGLGRRGSRLDAILPTSEFSCGAVILDYYQK